MPERTRRQRLASPFGQPVSKLSLYRLPGSTYQDQSDLLIFLLSPKLISALLFCWSYHWLAAPLNRILGDRVCMVQSASSHSRRPNFSKKVPVTIDCLRPLHPGVVVASACLTPLTLAGWWITILLPWITWYVDGHKFTHTHTQNRTLFHVSSIYAAATNLDLRYHIKEKFLGQCRE